jgi:hypothetical protein
MVAKSSASISLETMVNIETEKDNRGPWMEENFTEDVMECTRNLSTKSNYHISQRNLKSKYLHNMQTRQDCISPVKLTLWRYIFGEG